MVAVLFGAGLLSIATNVSADFSVDLTVDASGTFIGPTVVKASDSNIGIINITIDNTAVGIADTFEWINVTITNSSNIQEARLWRESDHNGAFTMADTPLRTNSSPVVTGNFGYYNFSGFSENIDLTSTLDLYVSVNLTASPVHGQTINVTVVPENISLTLAGNGDHLYIWCDGYTTIDINPPEVEYALTQDPDKDGCRYPWNC